MAIVVTVDRPDGTLLPELVHWLPTEALGEPIGTVSPAALNETSSIVAALVS
jgi:mRNA-degrading endonuclease toxin of MazEF toxin-antitoxin module